MRFDFVRTAVLALLVSSAGASAYACSVSCTYDAVLSATKVLVDPATRSVADPLEQVVAVASQFSVLAGSDGTTIYPAGTVVDRAELSSGTLSVYLTFPAGVEKGSLEEFQVYHGSEILRYYFADSLGLSATVVFARSAGEEDYVSVEKFIHRDEVPSVSPRDAGLDYEIGGPGPQPAFDVEPMYEQLRQQNVSPRDVPGQGGTSTSGMPQGALAGRIIFTYGGHGRTWDVDHWRWQRGYVNGMLEDFGNADASDYYANYCFNAGATVVSFRPIGYQDNEVVLDNTSPGVTRTGTWNNSVNARYYGSGTPNYYWASSANTETATVTYTPNIPEAGYYPVYTWANYGSDRIPGGQLYRIRSTGGESLVRIDHRRIGCGWVYLGSYYFEAGSNPATGSVVVSNQNPPGVTGTNYVSVADAIRFGNGMGDVLNGGTVSGYSRREESTVYWIENGWGHGAVAGTWDAGDVWDNSPTANDENLSWSAPPRMAASMLRLHSGDSTYQYALYLGWHSNAGGSSVRGSMGLITGTPTANQTWWATKVADEVDAASLLEDANWEYTWVDRSSPTYTSAYGEITRTYFQSKMDATIIEVAFHSNVRDAALMRDPKVRNIHGRAAYHAAVQYFNHFRGGPLAYLPERPQRFQAVNNGSGGVSLSWAPGLSGGTRGQAATSYRVYQSPDGLGWGSGVTVTGTNTTINGLTPGETYYFRVTGLNAGGESFPTETLAVRVTSSGMAKVLVVNGFDRLDRFNNILRPAGESGVPEQLNPRRNNTYDYVRQHAQAIAAANWDFDSTSNEAVISGAVSLNDYDIVVWILGEESSADDTFNVTERNKVQGYLALGKSLFVSGAEVGYELDGTNVDEPFYRNSLRSQYLSDNSLSYFADGAAGSIFEGISDIDFAPTSDMYDVNSADVITPSGGSVNALVYGASGGMLDNFDGIGNWKAPSYSGTTRADSSTFGIVTSPRQEGTGSGRLHYDWTEGNVVREYNSASVNFPKNSTIRISVYGDNSGHTLRFFVRDSVDAELFQSPAFPVNWSGWKTLTWNLVSDPLSKFAGTGDGIMSGAVRLDSIYMVQATGPNSGNIYFDDANYTVPATSTRTAAVQYAGTYKLVSLAFPFEAIRSAEQREEIMAKALDFFRPISAVADWSMY